MSPVCVELVSHIMAVVCVLYQNVLWFASWFSPNACLCDGISTLLLAVEANEVNPWCSRSSDESKLGPQA